jgi:hypothetical protein
LIERNHLTAVLGHKELLFSGICQLLLALLKLLEERLSFALLEFTLPEPFHISFGHAQDEEAERVGAVVEGVGQFALALLKLFQVDVGRQPLAGRPAEVVLDILGQHLKAHVVRPRRRIIGHLGEEHAGPPRRRQVEERVGQPRAGLP